MTSEIHVGDSADEYAQRVIKETVMMFQVRYDPKRSKIIFLGTDVLTAALAQGVEIERYVTEKIAQARESLVEQQ